MVNLVLAFGRTRQVELDDFGWARAHQEQQTDVGSARQQLADHAVKFFVYIGQTGQITLVDDGGAKAGLGKNHHARCRLDQVGAGARAHHQKESVLDFAVQPDDAGEAAKNFTLAAFDQRHDVGTAGGFCADRDDGAHVLACAPVLGKEVDEGFFCSRAMRSLRMYCAALMA